jgi:hypothetical protein
MRDQIVRLIDTASTELLFPFGEKTLVKSRQIEIAPQGGGKKYEGLEIGERVVPH